MSFIIEFLVEVFFEAVIELVGYCYLKLMSLIVPEKAVSNRIKKKIKRIVTVISASLAIVLIIGVILFALDDPLASTIGMYMTYIPLAIIALQILLGIVMKVAGYLKRRSTHEESK